MNEPRRLAARRLREARTALAAKYRTGWRPVKGQASPEGREAGEAARAYAALGGNPNDPGDLIRDDPPEAWSDTDVDPAGEPIRYGTP